ETATGAAFAHTAVLAGRPGNRAPLTEAGRLFGRLAHLLDAVEDQETDAVSGAWNPLTATGTPRAEARRLADDAVHGIRLALRDAEFTDGRLAHVLLAHELRVSVDRAFGTTACAHPGHGGTPAGHLPGTPPRAPGAPGMPGAPQGPHPEPPRPGSRGFLAGCAAFAALCCTCRMCCAESYEGPWSGKQREGCCHKCDCDGNCCDCDGGCCDCCGCCDCSC
ncbi:hypothetical protein GT042_33515, partial [Streptomyces sp. SID3212]